jgi:GNAT superfamily N-acetyltransferase
MRADTSCEIIRYRPDLKTDLLHLQVDLWGRDLEQSRAYFEWKYEHNPYLPEPVVHLALQDGRLVGMRAMFGAEWEVGSPPRSFLAPCAADSVIAPAHRNRGLFAAMTSAALRELEGLGVQYAFNLSAGHVTFLNSLAMGWRFAGSPGLALWQSPFSRIAAALVQRAPVRSSSLASVARGFANLSGVGSDAFARLDRSRARLEAPISVAQSPRPAEMARLIQRIGHDGRLRHVRDERYFAWRFLNPSARYRFLFWEERQLEGYLVLRATIAAGREVSLVDWEASSHRVLAGLLTEALGRGRFDGVRVWPDTLPAAARLLLRAHGFRRGEAKGISRYSPSILVRAAREDRDKGEWNVCDRSLLELGTWDLRMIYCDGY